MEYLSIGRGTAYALVHKKRIPFVRTGGIVRFRKKEIDKWLEGGWGAPVNKR